MQMNMRPMALYLTKTPELQVFLHDASSLALQANNQPNGQADK